MPSPSPSSPLNGSLATLISLIAHCRTSLYSPTYTTPALTTAPLDLLHDTATLSKAHITRLSVALRPPVTIDAAQKYITDLSTSIVPTLTAATASCNPAIHGRALASEARAAVDALLAALTDYADGSRGDRLLSTGVVWSAADRVCALRERGTGGVVAAALAGYAEMVRDAGTELRAWVDEEDEDGSEEEEDGEDGEDEQGFWDRPTRSARLDEVTRERAEAAVRLLKLVGILFGAARKRRLDVGAEGKLATVLERVDRIAEVGGELSSLADELVAAFYEEEDLETGDSARENLVRKAVELAELCCLADNGEKDTYSTWFENCKAALEKFT